MADDNSDTVSGLWSDGVDENGAVKGYMCLVDWQHHVGFDSAGNDVFWSEECLRRARKCVVQCGIVEVELRAVRIVAPQDFSDAIAKSEETNV